MSARILPLSEVDAALLERWRMLGRQAVEPNPFAEADFVLPAAHLVGRDDRLAVIVVERGDELHFALPVTSNSRFRRIPVPAVTTWLHDYCFLGSPLVAPGSPEETWEQVLELMEDLAPWAAFGLLGAGGPVITALSVALAARGDSASTLERPGRPVLRRRPEETYLEALSGNRRAKLRRLRPRMAAATGSEVRCVDHTSPGEDLERTVEGFLEMEGRSWKGRDGGAMACHPGHDEFFREVCRRFAAAGTLRLRVLEVGDAAVAYECLLLAGRSMFGFKMTFDEAFRRYSPGVTLLLDTIAAFHREQRFDLFDSCMGPAPSLLADLFPDRRDLVDALVPLDGVLGQVAAHGTPLAASVYRRVKRTGDAVGARLRTRSAGRH
jgi:CelD/BcsL family acetyltransferase involved in cellulose biosynthesis